MAASILFFSIIARWESIRGGFGGDRVTLGFILAMPVIWRFANDSRENLSASLNYFWPIFVILMIGFGYMIHDDSLAMIVVKVGAMLSMLATIRWHFRYLPERREPEIPKVENPESW